MKEKGVSSIVVLFPLLLCAVLLSVLPGASLTPENTPYEHVILIVVDGVRPDILAGANTPNIDNLTASGSFTWNAWTVTPSGTIAAIPSIFTGATPEVHGVTNWDGEIYAETIVEVFEEAGLPCAIVGEDPILGGYSATYCTSFYYHPQAEEHFMTRAIDLLWENDFYFISVYNPMPDHMGHEYGHGSPEYREAIENADYHIGRLVENLELGVYENTLIVITTDHGMTGKSHSAGCETDMRIFSIWRGPGVERDYEMVDAVCIQPKEGGYAKVRIHAVDDKDWSELGITWNNQPELGDVIANGLVNIVGWCSWDVTGFVAEQFAQDEIVNIAMIDADENLLPDHAAAFETKEWWNVAEHPYLEVKYSSPGDPVSTTRVEPIADSYVRQDMPNSNFGKKTHLWAGRYRDGAERAFLKFDLGAIPAGSSITEAKYHNYCWSLNPAGYQETYVAHRTIDIAPTITRLAGLSPPENAEGNVITQILEAKTPSGFPLILVIGAVAVVVVIIGVILVIRPF